MVRKRLWCTNTDTGVDEVTLADIWFIPLILVIVGLTIAVWIYVGSKNK